ncbi:hypothetical protein N7468_006232 [Penicillium chermesinum]|uniref:Uncharacterized protein n=1 Tax=Penicillium chermesinum TaxID=63820 RepID=A0A9W9NRV4_9EURO|nr:uncharacterized protein N7468_006232 [Penicillium chermesinum]KAJ5225007.1 hypothetical protein N7468_006232 [Penicillium chermesinum]
MPGRERTAASVTYHISQPKAYKPLESPIRLALVEPTEGQRHRKCRHRSTSRIQVLFSPQFAPQCMTLCSRMKAFQTQCSLSPVPRSSHHIRRVMGNMGGGINRPEDLSVGTSSNGPANAQSERYVHRKLSPRADSDSKFNASSDNLISKLCPTCP